MEPIAVTVRGERRWMLIHRCTRCGRLRLNRTAADDNVLLLLQLAALPLATPPVPHARFGADDVVRQRIPRSATG
jgi:RNHCP domain